MAKIAIPTSSEELGELLADRKRLDEVYKDPQSFSEFLLNYAKAANKADRDISRQVEESVQAALASFATDHGVQLKRPDMSPATARDVMALNKSMGTHYTDGKAEGSPLNGKFENFGEFLRVIDHRQNRSEPAVRDRLSEVKNALSSNVPAEGGFLIPEEFRAELLRVAMEEAVVRPRARVIPMASLRVSLPMLDETTRASSVFGGVIAYWTEEAASLVESKPSFGKVVLDAKKLTAYSDIPNELGDDSAISLNAFVGEAFPQAIAWYEDDAFMNGDGAGMPLGALDASNPALIVQAATAAGNSIEWADAVNMFSRMLPGSLNRAVWVVTPDAFPQLALMQAPGGISPIWVSPGGGPNTPPTTLLGRPIIITEKAPGTLGNQGDISFVDFGHYLIGDRMAMTAMTSPHYKFGQDVTSYRVIERVDGRPWIQSPITPKNGGPTLSPFVQLAGTGR